MSVPTKYDDTIDSRNVISRLDDLKEELTDVFDALSEELSVDEYSDFDSWIEYVSDYGDHPQYDDACEFKALSDLAEQCEGYSDWAHGETLIRDSYFETYCEAIAEEIGAIDRDAKWPLNCIDWEQAARELKYDYMEVSFDGVSYWMRA